MPYRHAYHAGGYADVVKHCMLILLLERMQLKESPMVYVDTHAGAGRYDLSSMEAQRLREHERGIDIAMRRAGPEPLETLKSLVDGDSYPGSPAVASSLLRPQDSMVLIDKDPLACEALTAAVSGATVLCEDGYKALRGLRRDHRALVFCDPAYQLGGDTERAANLARELHKHWKSARFALWYPVRPDRAKTDRLHTVFRDLDLGDCLVAELGGDDVVGTGLLMLHPPFGIDGDLESLLPPLARVLDDGSSSRSTARLTWLRRR